MKSLFIKFFLVITLPVFVFCQTTEKEINQLLAKCGADKSCMIDIYKQVVPLIKNKFGRTNETYQTCLFGLSGFLVNENKIEEAFPHIQELIDAKIVTYGEDSQETRSMLNLFVTLIRSKGDKERANILERRLTANKPQLSSSITQLNDLQSLFQRKEYCISNGNWDCVKACLEKIVPLLKAEKGEHDPQYLEELKLLAYQQISSENWQDAIINLEILLAEKKNGEPYLSDEERQEIQMALDGVYQATGRKIKYKLKLTSKLEKNATIDQILAEIDRLNKENYPIFQNSQEYYIEYIRYVLPIQAQFIEKVEKEKKGKHHRYEEILYQIAEQSSSVAVTTEDATEKRIYVQKSNIALNKLLPIVERRVGKLHNDYSHLLESKAANFMMSGETGKQIEVLEELILLYRQFVSKENEDYQRALYTFLTQAPPYDTKPNKEQRYRSYMADYIENEEDDVNSIDFSLVMTGQNTFSATTVADSMLSPVRFPNILDTMALHLEKSNYQQIKKYLDASFKRMNLKLLFLEDDAVNAALLGKFQIELEALTSFVVIAQEKYPQLTNELFTHIAQYNYLVRVQQERIRQRQLLKDFPKYSKIFQEWMNQKKLVNQFYLSNQTLTKVADRQERFWAEQKLIQIEKELARAVNERYTPPPSPDWKILQNKLKADEAFIEMLRFVPREKGAWSTKIAYAALIVRPNLPYPVLVYLPNGEDLDIKLFRAYLNSRFYGDTGALYQAYWASIQKHLDGIKKVYISPVGVYHKINLNTLQIPNTQNEFLSDRLDIQLVGSLMTLLQNSKMEQPITDAVLIGDPLYDLTNKNENDNKTQNGYYFRSPIDIEITEKTKWNRLPQTKVEVDSINSLLKSKGIKTYPYLQEQAQEQVVKQMTSPSILHIATHAYFSSFINRSMIFDLAVPKPENDEYPYMSALLLDKKIEYKDSDSIRIEWNPELLEKYKSFNKDFLSSPQYFNPMLNAALIFAGANNHQKEDDGILTAYEINGLNFSKTQLVVLSACDSGVSDLGNGKGVAGLRGAFESAGVNYIVNTLWKVEDSISQKFMLLFYKNWLTNGQSIETAFKNAQLSIRAELIRENPRNHIYLWGAFVLVDL
jgi:CHAT domain-containing protein